MSFSKRALMCVLRYNDQKKNIKQAKKCYYAQKTVLLKISIIFMSSNILEKQKKLYNYDHLSRN